MRTVIIVLLMALMAVVSVSALQTQTRLREPVVESEMEFVDESAFVEQNPATATVIAPAAVPVVADPVTAPANMTAPPASLKKPIIFENSTRSSKDPSAPLTGPVPQKLKKAAISKNIYGGAVTFKRGRDANGCPCKKQVPEKYRYDAQYKPEKLKYSNKCCCKKKAKKPKLPPVVAELYPKKPKAKKLKPCAKPKAKKPKIAPEYYPAKAKKAAKKKPCAKPEKKNVTITPEFYPVRKEKLRKRSSRRAVRLVARNAKKVQKKKL